VRRSEAFQFEVAVSRTSISNKDLDKLYRAFPSPQSKECSLLNGLSPSSLLMVIGFVVLLASGWAQQQIVDKWTRDTGRAPMINKGRGSWSAYMRVAKHEMPAPIRKKIALFRWIGCLALLLILVTASTDARWYRH
jgi:hypothetical protein